MKSIGCDNLWMLIGVCNEHVGNVNGAQELKEDENKDDESEDISALFCKSMDRRVCLDEAIEKENI